MVFMFNFLIEIPRFEKWGKWILKGLFRSQWSFLLILNEMQHQVDNDSFHWIMTKLDVLNWAQIRICAMVS